MDWRTYWNENARVKDADPCRQVGRTFRGHSYSPAQLSSAIDRILAFLEATPEKKLLDLACGNGLLTSRLADHFKTVTAVDFSLPLIESARLHFNRANIDYVLGDVLELGTLSGEYECILVSFAFQYFSPGEAERLFRGFARLLSNRGRVFLADVADGDRVWNFYKGLSGRGRFYFDRIRDRPVIGYWWKPAELGDLAHRHGFRLSINYQGSEMPNHYFRYDALLER